MVTGLCSLQLNSGRGLAETSGESTDVNSSLASWSRTFIPLRWVQQFRPQNPRNQLPIGQLASRPTITFFFIILILGFLFQEVFFSSRLQLPPTEVPFFWSFKFEVRPLPGPIFHRVGRVPAGSRCPSLQDTFVATKPVGNSPGRGTLKPYFSFTFQILVQPPYRLVALNILLNQTY